MAGRASESAPGKVRIPAMTRQRTVPATAGPRSRRG
jgi:hypothetical protein